MRNDRVEQKKWYDRLVREDSDVALVRIFECFLEATPQKILQITIILSGEDEINCMSAYMTNDRFGFVD